MVTAEIAGVRSNSLDVVTTAFGEPPFDVELPSNVPMSFGTDNSTVISAQSQSTALLPCVVHNLGDGVVSYFFFLIRTKVSSNEW